MKKSYKLIRVLPLMMLMLMANLGFGQEVVNTAFGPETGVFTAEFDVVPSHSPMNAGVGLSDVEVGTWGDMACIVGFHPGGIIRAYNSSGYEYENEIPYSADSSYHIVMTVDVANQLYSVTVTPGSGAAIVLATDYGFRADASVLNNYASYNDTNTVWGGVPGATLDITNFTPALPDVVTTYTEDFEDAVSLTQWRPNGAAHPDGTPAFDVSQSDGVLHNAVSQVNFWDGQFINFTTHENLIFDITDNTYISFDVKIEPGATYGGVEVDTVPFLVSPWGPNADGDLQREFLAINLGVPDDGEWHTVRYDISESFGLPDWDGSIIENDYSEIQAILVENVIWPDTYAFTMDFDNFKVGAAAAPPTVVTTYTEDFEDAVSLAQWRPNGATHPDGTPAFDVSQSDGVLHNAVSQVNFWDGQFINFTTHENLIFDITDNTYISFDVKIEPGATYGGVEVDTVPFLVSPWGPNADGDLQREFLAINLGVPDDGEWHTVRYDISESFGLPDWDGSIIENDYSEIQAILVENVIWPDTYAFTMDFDNFKVGEAAAPAVPPTVVTTYWEDFEDAVSLDQWRPNGATHPDGTPAFDVSQSDGVLHNAVSQVNFWDGQFINFTTNENLIFDITDNTYISFDVKIEQGATYGGVEVDTVPFLVSPWGPNADGDLMREFLAINLGVPDDGEWHTVRYDISDHFGLPDWDGTILENDYSEIQAILVENVIWPDTYAFNMDFDNFKVGEAAAPVIPPTVVTTYWEDFEDAVSFDQWVPNGATHPDGTPAFDVSQADGVLHNAVSQVNFWDGQFFNFTTHENLIFDITDNTYISFDVKIEPGATYGGVEVDTVPFLVSPWGPNADGDLMREFLAINLGVPDDGEWHTVRYDISDHFGLPDWDGTILENDYSEIQAILVENVIWPDTYAFTMDFDNFKVGEAAAPVIPPTVVTTYLEDFEETVSLEQWVPNGATHPDGTPAFDVSQVGGVLNNIVSQVNFWDGQFFNFRTHENLIFDITENPFIAFDVKIEPGATYGGVEVDTVPFLVSPWGPNVDGDLMREFLAINLGAPDDGEWHTITYDISTHFGLPDWDGTILENDYSEIEAILVENVIWPDTYAFTMDFDNFAVGAAARPVGVFNPENKLAFNAYPNPVSQTLILEAEEAIETVRVFDAQGRLVSTHNMNAQERVSLDVSELITGLYLIEVRSAGKVSTKKISKR